MGKPELKPFFIKCQFCGKKLIERKANGMFYFMFGKPAKEGSQTAPVEMLIQGNIKIKCLRRSCAKWQVLNYFPSVFAIANGEPDHLKQKE